MSDPQKPSRDRAVLIALVIAATGYVWFAMLWGFDWFPGLHGDEAWVGLRAIENAGRGFFTLEGMNSYSGAVHPYVVSLAFRAMGASVASLRLVGIAWNLLAVAILVVHLARRFGLRSALLFLLLLSGSVLLLFKARLAWEVCACNAVLCAAVLVSSHALLDEQSVRGRFRLSLFAFVFFASAMLGLLNHYVFGCVSIAVLAASAVLGLAVGGVPETRFLLVNLINAAALFAVYRVKRIFLDEAVFGRNKAAVLVGLVLLPFAELVVFHLLSRVLAIVRSRGWVDRALGGDGLRRRIVRWLRVLLLGCIAAAVPAGLALFAGIHGDGFVGALSGSKVMMRLFSWTPSAPMQIAGWVFVVAIACGWIVGTLGALRDCVRREVSPYAALLMLLPPFYGIALAASTHVSSLRHFAPAVLLLFVALASRAPAIRSRRRTIATLVAVGAFAVATQSAAWSAMGGAAIRPPIRFAIGSGTETSAHFRPTRDLYEDLKEQGICRYEAEPDDAWFVAYPLYFYRSLDGYTCDNPVSVWMSYCDGCADPPGFEVHRRGR